MIMIMIFYTGFLETLYSIPALSSSGLGLQSS